jgi:hypothetical protein
MLKKLLLTGAALLALTTTCRAGLISDLGLDPNLSIARNFTSGTFTDDYTFTLDASKTITIVGITNTFAGGVTGTRFIKNFTGSVFSDGLDGLPFTGDDVIVIGPTPATLGCGIGSTICQSLAGSAVIDAGAYYVQLTGTGGALASYGGNITTIAAVPEPSTWAMILLGFVGLAWAGRRKRSGSRLSQFA